MKRLFITLAAVLAFCAASGQQSMPVPVDQKVRTGKLDNGITYYIRHNAEPAGQANFYIAQKVGSILEEEDQRGLAHFLEHMCFNGTQNFPGNGIIKYCESIGVKFGANLNAYTSIDETVYNIDNVPVANVPSAIDSCLLILHDWADGLLLTDQDIDHERGVIHEEWRTRSNAQMRMYEKILPAIYPDGNRYGLRMPIGLMSVVDNFPYKALRDYYEKWYRPDQQGIIVVGDIDVDAIEAKIKNVFGTIAKPENPAERFYVQVPDNKEPIVTIAKDKEQPYAMAYIFQKHEAFPTAAKSDIQYCVYTYVQSLIDKMMQDRIQELLQSPQPPFIQGFVADDGFFLAKTKRAYTGIVVCAETDLEKASTTLYREMLRAARGGFTASEFERAKAEILSQIETRYNQREKKKSAEYCREYVRHFIDNEPIPGIEWEYAIVQQLAPGIPLEAVNQIVKSYFGEGNLAVACMLPDKEGISYPSEDQLKAAFAAVAAEDIKPYVEEVSNEPLLPTLPAEGAVKSVKDDKFGYRKMTLSNGATVYFKHTEFNKDEVRMSAFSKGGTSLYPVSMAPSLKVVDEVMSIGGVGNFSKTALNKVLAGKVVSVNPSINLFGEGVSAKTTPKDLETMLQLNYLYFTSLRQDDEAFASWQTRTKSSIKNQEADPMSAVRDSLRKTIFTGKERVASMKPEDVDALDYAAILGIARERFANAGDFTFIITGNVDEQTLLPLVRKYIASLPSTKKKEKANLKANDYVKGKVENVFERGMEIPMCVNFFLDQATVKYTLKNSVAYDLALNALTVVLLEEIREKEGGTYGIGAYGSLSGYPRTQAECQIGYQCNPDRVDYLNGRVREIVAKFAAEGPSEENLNKGKEYFIKNYKEGLAENSFYATALKDYLQTGVDSITDYEAVVNSVTVEDARAIFSAVLKQGNHAEIIMKGIPAAK